MRISVFFVLSAMLVSSTFASPSPEPRTYNFERSLEERGAVRCDANDPLSYAKRDANFPHISKKKAKSNEDTAQPQQLQARYRSHRPLGVPNKPLQEPILRFEGWRTVSTEGNLPIARPYNEADLDKRGLSEALDLLGKALKKGFQPKQLMRPIQRDLNDGKWVPVQDGPLQGAEIKIDGKSQSLPARRDFGSGYDKEKDGRYLLIGRNEAARADVEEGVDDNLSRRDLPIYLHRSLDTVDESGPPLEARWRNAAISRGAFPKEENSNGPSLEARWRLLPDVARQVNTGTTTWTVTPSKAKSLEKPSEKEDRHTLESRSPFWIHHTNKHDHGRKQDVRAPSARRHQRLTRRKLASEIEMPQARAEDESSHTLETRSPEMFPFPGLPEPSDQGIVVQDPCATFRSRFPGLASMLPISTDMPCDKIEIRIHQKRAEDENDHALESRTPGRRFFPPIPIDPSKERTVIHDINGEIITIYERPEKREADSDPLEARFRLTLPPTVMRANPASSDEKPAAGEKRGVDDDDEGDDHARVLRREKRPPRRGSVPQPSSGHGNVAPDIIRAPKPKIEGIVDESSPEMQQLRLWEDYIKASHTPYPSKKDDVVEILAKAKAQKMDRRSLDIGVDSQTDDDLIKCQLGDKSCWHQMYESKQKLCALGDKSYWHSTYEPDVTGDSGLQRRASEEEGSQTLEDARFDRRSVLDFLGSVAQLWKDLYADDKNVWNGRRRWDCSKGKCVPWNKPDLTRSYSGHHQQASTFDSKPTSDASKIVTP